jgi:acetyl esterase/lipase
MCAAGLTVVSPAVRGSDGFGKAFRALNDRDLGGDEIVDLFHVARWTERNLGLTPADRRLRRQPRRLRHHARPDLPPATNGRNDSYPFGFGLSHAGFSDIKSFHDQCNIPDWVVLESGDPAVPTTSRMKDRMRDRSPLTHVDLPARRRIPASSSPTASQRLARPRRRVRAFADKAKALGKPVTYVEFAGQGHHIEGLACSASSTRPASTS